MRNTAFPADKPTGPKAPQPHQPQHFLQRCSILRLTFIARFRVWIVSWTGEINSLQLVCPTTLQIPMLRAGNCSASSSRKRQELALSLLLSIHPNAIHKTAGKLSGDYTLRRTEVFNHAISPHQLHSSSSVSTGLQVGPQCTQGGTLYRCYTSNHSQDKLWHDTLSTNGLKSHAQGCGDGSPSPSSIAQGNALLTVSPLPAISSLVIDMGVSSKYQGQDRAPANERAQTLLQASTECLSLEAGD